MAELYSLPNGWEWKKLGELCDFIRGPFGGSLKKQIFKENGNAVYEQSHAIYNQFEQIRYFIDDEKFEEMKRFELRPNSLIMSCSGTIGKVAIVPNNVKKGIINQALLMLTPNNELNNIFLKLMMESNFFQTLLSENSTGAAIANVASVKVLKDLDIPLPPLEEQKRIVVNLDILFAKIDKAIALHQKNIDEADIFMASVLNDVFVELEENFQVKTIKDISNIISGYAFKSGDFSNDNKIKSIKITNVGVQNFVEEDDNFLPEELLNKLSKYTANYGDIAIALTRPYISNGLKVTYIPKTYDGAFINQRVAVIQSNEKFTSNNFIYHYLCTSNVLSNVMELSKTLNQPNLSIKDLSNFEIPLPSLETQQKVVAYLDEISNKIEKIKQIQKEKMQSLKELKASILDKAFKGEL
ncbi:Type-1 restriction enzyme EcoKI specificity protein [Aliarcobacter thereius]|uniref:restriction endonuclease subunit S n=1 Tax=Aliarcobacter thereius TaxID=544718 RepID=UPI00082896DD|nr:restriction endonuclease subunit S [Aliarcobacter thereius]OCL87756.1 Type-1 restriction enzyme EcoKI specificity protein [Aliarcobacter thereius]